MELYAPWLAIQESKGNAAVRRSVTSTFVAASGPPLCRVTVKVTDLTPPKIEVGEAVFVSDRSAIGSAVVVDVELVVVVAGSIVLDVVEVVVSVVLDVVDVVEVEVPVPSTGQLAGAAADRARNRSPSSFTIVPPKKPQKRTLPTSMMMPTPPCEVPPS